MKDYTATRSDDSNDSENSDDDDSTSTAHLYFVEDGDPNGRGAGEHHHPDAYDHFNSGGDMYSAFTKKGSGRRNAWSVSDTLSHIAMAYGPLAEVFPDDPRTYVEFTNDVMGAAISAVKGNKGAMLDWLTPDASDIVDYVSRSDAVDFDAIVQEIKDRQSDDDDSE